MQSLIAAADEKKTTPKINKERPKHTHTHTHKPRRCVKIVGSHLTTPPRGEEEKNKSRRRRRRKKKKKKKKKEKKRSDSMGKEGNRNERKEKTRNGTGADV